MSNSDQLNQRIKRVLERLTKAQKKYLYARLLLWLIVSRVRQFVYRLFKSRPRARAHWISKRPRAARPHRVYIILTFALAILCLEPYEYAVWSVTVGGATSWMVTVHSIYRVFSRNRAHWID